MMGTPNASEFWEGEGGNAYTQRNRVDWRKRIPFWRRVIDQTGARSVYEFGCNAGWNLSAIQRVEWNMMCYGHDINVRAVEQARRAGLFEVTCGDRPATRFKHDSYDPLLNSDKFKEVPLYEPNSIELTFTAGLLIHIPPEHLEQMMKQVIALSCQYVLAIEYEATAEHEVEYRGQRGLLWRRPYGVLYENMGLKPVSAWNAGEGFDRCTAWLMEKP